MYGNLFVTGDEREKLYTEVWTEPVVIVAKRYGISDVALRKRCNKLGIPVPYSGYWARISAGQKIARTPLPEVTGELRKYVRNYIIKYKHDVNELSDSELLVDEELNLLTEETKTYIKEKCANVHVNKILRNPHSLIIEYQKELENRHQKEKELKQSSGFYYSRSENILYRNFKSSLPIHVSENNLNRAYRIIDVLIKTIEEMEGRVSVDLYIGKDVSHIIVLQSYYEIELREEGIKEKRSTPKDRKMEDKIKQKPKGNLVFTFSLGSSYGQDLKRVLIFNDADEPLESQLGNIIYQLFVTSNRQYSLEELRSREIDRRYKEEERKRRLEEIRQGELKELKLLQQAASDWDMSERIRKFADCIEREISEVTDDKKRDKLLKWLKWARDKADWIDPITEKDDELLGKSKHLFEIIEDEYK